MSKKRFVEFYLAAMMKAATDGRVIRLAYTYNPATKGMAAQAFWARRRCPKSATTAAPSSTLRTWRRSWRTPERERERERELPGQLRIEGC